jgi:lipoate-protein ligase A
MIPIVCRILPHKDGDGPTNMARDEAMLDAVAAEPRSALFRTYGWAELTLSLGYFQSVSEAEADPRWLGAPIVRRPTGGGAIWHHHEVTYALAVPRDHPLATRTIRLYQEVHAAIAAVIREQGVEVRRRDVAASEREGGRRPFLCFNDSDPEDLVVGTSKVVGSAQRRRSGVLLQHGSLLLGRSEQTPELPGLGDLAGVATDRCEWAKELCARVPQALGFLPEPTDWTEAILSRARLLEQTVYRGRAWTRRR